MKHMHKVDLEKIKNRFNHLFNGIGKVIVGQNEMVEQLLITLLCDSNALLESYPGLAKTLTIKTLANLLDLKYSRIQSTPDLMPSDITGTYIIEETKHGRHFRFQPGPIFANIILADEINRASPKTQSALLEAMQEKQVTVGNKTFPLDLPFFVLATQNPIEMEGVFALPEAQLDRFLMKIKIDYPTIDDEMEIVKRYTRNPPSEHNHHLLRKVDILSLQKLVRQVPISNKLKQKVVDVVTATRKNKSIQYGASPRASIGLVLAAKARALMNGRAYVSEGDINKLAYPVLRHRIILNFEAQRDGLTTDDIIKDILKKHK